MKIAKFWGFPVNKPSFQHEIAGFSCANFLKTPDFVDVNTKMFILANKHFDSCCYWSIMPQKPALIDISGQQTVLSLVS